MMLKLFGRFAAARPFVFAFFALASFAASAFDTPYLTFRSASSFSLSVSSPKWDGKIEYSTDTENWTEWNGSSVSAALSDGQYRLYLRGENNTNLNGGNYSGWSLTGSNICCEGDIETLRGYDGNVPAMGANCYSYLFRDCTSLKSLPILSATSVADFGYYNMFAGCTGIEIYDSAPDATWSSVAWSLPANVTGGSIWYYDMFKDTGGSFTGNPTAGTTYYVASALPPGQMYQAVNSGTLAPVFSGAALNVDLTLTIKNGTTPYVFAHAGGTLPPGVAPSGSSLSGTPTTPGTYSFTLSVTDAENHTFGSAESSIVVMAPMSTVSTSYIDASGTPQTHDCLELNANVATWDQSWYVVSGNLDFGTGGITVDGNVNLVLADGASMSVVGGPGKAGINVPYGSSLTIYGQSGGTGTLTASGNPNDEYGSGGAGVGGNTADWQTGYENCGTITINGGRIIASSGNGNAAGIGGGYYGYCGMVTINGGIVTATANSEYEWGTASGAGIGGGANGGGGTVVINGGNVTAIAEGVPDEFDEEYASVGIGRGSYGYGGNFTVADNVTVNAGDSADALEVLPHGAGGAITVTSQRYFVIETEGSLPLAQKSGTSAYTVYTDEVFNLSLASTISGGTQPYAFALASGTLPAGLSFNSTYTTISGTPTTDDIEEKTVVMTVTDGDAGSTNATYTIKATTRTKTITYIDGLDGATVLTGLTPTNYTPGVSYEISLPSLYTVSALKEGYTCAGWYRNPEFTGGTVSKITPSVETTNLTFYAKFTKDAPVSYSLYYYDYEESTGQTQLYYDPGSYTSDDLPLNLPTPVKDGYTFVGWGESYASDVTITTLPIGTTGYKTLYAKWIENTPEPPEPDPGEGDIEVSFVDENGSPMVRLCTVVTAETTTFTNGGWYVVNASVNCSGAITVEGSASLVLVDGKTLTISEVENFKAGISVAEGCSFTVYGQSGNAGVLNVTGGSNGAGIGGDTVISGSATCGAITINGGTVNATGGNYAAGIGGANNCNCGSVTINGGIVHAEGTGYGSGIGGGARSSGGAVTINGGSVTAESGVSGRAGIGSGYTWGDVVVSNGSLYIAPGLVVYAGANEQNTELREADATTHLLAVDDGWHYFLIEESVAPVGTFYDIEYRDSANGALIQGLSPSQYEEGVGVSLATAVPSKSGYTFAYWYESGAEDVPVTAVPADATGDKTLYAKWTPTEFTIEYYLKGEKVELFPSNYTVAAVTKLPEEANGYYVKWHDNPELEGDWIFTIGAGSGYARNIKLYADADPIPYTITFYDSETGEQFIKPYLYTVGYNAEFEAFDLPRTAHKDWRRFVDWYDNIDLEGDPVRTISTGSFGNKKFYAKWEETTDVVLTVDTNGNLVAASLNGNTEVTIPNTVQQINTFVFYGFTTMEAVTIPSTVTNIDDFAFCNCKSLRQIELPESLRRIGWCAFDTCSALESVYIPKGVTIGDDAFFLCESLKSVNIGGTVTQSRRMMKAASGKNLLAAAPAPLLGVEPEDSEAIHVGRWAFACCGNLESAKVGSKVAGIGGGVFSGCSSLDTIDIENNDNYVQRGNFLLTSDGKTLVSAFGDETAMVVSNGVETIQDGAFAGSTALTSVVLPSGVTTIGEAAFSNATVFASITIPASVTTIGVNAFCDTVLATVYVAKGDTERVQALVEGTGYTATVAYVESGSEPATDWPADTSTVEGQTAAEAFDITGDLATADAKKLADWAKENSVEFGDAIITDAYLLNCANTAPAVEAATETAEEAIKITAITFDSEGNPVLTCLATYGNGKVVVEGAESLTSPIQWHDKASGDKFFRTVLKP